MADSTAEFPGVPLGEQVIMSAGKGGDYVWLVGDTTNASVDLAKTTDRPQHWEISPAPEPLDGYEIRMAAQNGMYLAASPSHHAYLTEGVETLWQLDPVSYRIYRLSPIAGWYLYGHTSDKKVDLSQDSGSSGTWWVIMD